MSLKLPEFIKWRYDLYASEHVDLYGSISFYLKQKVSRMIRMRHPKIVYIYANKRNVGDYISFLGIKDTIKLEGVELFCSPMWTKQLRKSLSKIKANNPNCLIVIGGGGLIQPVFEPFWDVIMASELPYVFFGIGINKMPGRPEMAAEYISKILDKAQLCGVRDKYTQDNIQKLTDKEVYMGICPSVNFVHQHYWNEQINTQGELLHMFHPSDVRLAGADLDKIKAAIRYVANKLGLRYGEHNNMTANHEEMLTRVSKARLVVSSRLHGCIMSFAMGVPYIPLYCDEKIKSFNASHTGIQGLSPLIFHDQQEALLAIENALTQTDNYKAVITDKTEQNLRFSKKIKALLR